MTARAMDKWLQMQLLKVLSLFYRSNNKGQLGEIVRAGRWW